MLLNERKSTSPIYEGVEMVYFWMKYGSPSDPNASYPTREKPRSRRSVTSFWWSADIWPGIYQKSRLRLPETHQKIIIHRELWNRRLPGILWDTGCFSKKKMVTQFRFWNPCVRQSKREFTNFGKIISSIIQHNFGTHIPTSRSFPLNHNITEIWSKMTPSYTSPEMRIKWLNERCLSNMPS